MKTIVKAALMLGAFSAAFLLGQSTTNFDKWWTPESEALTAAPKNHKLLFENAEVRVLEVTVPEAHVGTITGDLSGKRGRIQGQDFLPGGMAVVKAQAPLSEVMQYQSQLKSVTGGQGSFIMELSHYEPVPPQVQKQLTDAYKPKVEED